MRCVQRGKDTEGEHAKRGKSEHRRGEVCGLRKFKAVCWGPVRGGIGGAARGWQGQLVCACAEPQGKLLGGSDVIHGVWDPLNQLP